MKTRGQRLYEHECPKHVTVVLLSDTFRRNPFQVLNPEFHPDWRFLSDRCQDEYERRAEFHSMFSGEKL